MKTNKRGISLIVLVITIIVMIVLAAAIILSLQSSGIIGRANEAKIKSDNTNMLQAASVAYSEYLIENNLEGLSNKTAEEYVKEKLSSKFSREDLEKLSVLTDGTVQILPKIPEGFVVSNILGEQKVSDGLVIYELNEGETTISDWTTIEAGKTYPKVQRERNQYVWIPVDNIADFVRKDGYEMSALQTFISTGEAKEPYESGYSTEIVEYNEMKSSVEKYGGFYIARYEAGKEGTNTAVSKKGAVVWNNIPWGTSMTEIGEEGAVYYSKEMYKNSNSVVSTLIYGVQWDAALNFLGEVLNPNVSGKKYIEDSLGMGYYAYNLNNSLIPGMVEACQPTGCYAVKNIYDMAGNVDEWTMEADDCCESRFLRGGNYYLNGSKYPASNRGPLPPYDAASHYGFRTALYMK